MTSTDATNWTVVTQLTIFRDNSYGFGGFATNGSTTVVVGQGSASDTTPIIYYSTDAAGLTWTASSSGATVFAGTFPYSVGWIGSRFIAFSSTVTGYSTDGITWTAATGGGGFNYNNYNRTWYGFSYTSVGSIG
jgi:hypothetical protein